MRKMRLMGARTPPDIPRSDKYLCKLQDVRVVLMLLHAASSADESQLNCSCPGFIDLMKLCIMHQAPGKFLAGVNDTYTATQRRH